MNNYRALTMVTLAVAAALPTAHATIFFVDAAHGDDTRSGRSQAAAWATLARVNRATLRPGDHLLLHGGQSFAGPLAIGAADAGDPRHLVTIGSYGSSYGGPLATIAVKSSDALIIRNTAGLRLENLVIQGGGAARDHGIGVHAMATGNGAHRLDTLQLSHLDVSGFRGGGVVVEAAGFRGFQNVMIDHVAAHDNGDVGIKVAGRYVTATQNDRRYSNAGILVTDSTAYRNHGDPSTGQNTGSGILLGQVQDGTVRFCSAWRNGGLGTNVGGGPVGIWAFDSTRILIEHNVSFENRSQPAGSGPDGDGFDLDGGTSHSLVQYNYARGNQGAGYLLTQFATARPFAHNLLRFNISEDDATGIGSYADNGTTIVDTAFDNNTIFASGQADTIQILPFGAYDGLAFRNNIVLNTGHGRLVNTPITAGVSLQGNFYWTYGADFAVSWGQRTYRSLDAWRAGSDVERLDGKPIGDQADPGLVAPGQGGIVADPRELRMLSAYHLGEHAAAIGRGLDLSRLFGTPVGPVDFYGQATEGESLSVGAALK